MGRYDDLREVGVAPSSRSLLMVLVLVVLISCNGCATIFTGTSQRITVTTHPPASFVVVVGTPMASVILAAKESSAVTRKVLELAGPALPEAARARLLRLDVDELITKLVLWARLDRLPPELAGHVDRVPPFVRDRLLGMIGVEAFGTSPLTVKLKKGRKYAVLSWREGHAARTAGIDMKFNWVVMVNVLNAFLGVPIDIVTGAWFNLSPSRLELVLPPRPAS